MSRTTTAPAPIMQPAHTSTLLLATTPMPTHVPPADTDGSRRVGTHGDVHVVGDSVVVVDGGARVDDAAVADYRVGVDHSARHDNRARADLDPAAYHRVGVDEGRQGEPSQRALRVLIYG